MNPRNIHSNTNHRLGKRKSDILSPLPLRQTKWLFFALCCYLISQAYTIPILPLGPWAVWPCLSDLAAALLVLAFLLNFRQASLASNANKRIFLTLIFVLLGSILSFTWYLTGVSEDAKGIDFGIFQIYRLVQFICIFWITAQIPLTSERTKALRYIVEAVFIFVCLGIWLTYTSILPLASVTAHLPQVGAWIYYEGAGKYGGHGLGFVGYNHSYGAAQTLMLVSLRIHLTSNQKKELSNTVFMLVSIATCFVTGSRSGLAVMLIFAIIYWFKKPIYGLILFCAVLVPILIALIIHPQLLNLDAFGNGNIAILERQATLMQLDNTDVLSGRDQIWQERITTLNQNASLLLVGSGFGSGIDSGDNAHMLYLHVLLETGLVGFCLFFILFFQIIYFLHLYEPGSIKVIFWATIVFLISSLTQETFYPVPSLGHFLGFYFCSVAIALRK